MSGKRHGEGSTPRTDRLIDERVHDPYRLRKKPQEPSVCPGCGAVFRQGRWQWLDEPPKAAAELTCTACRRIHDKVPAGYLELRGRFIGAHRDEILNLVNNTVDAQQQQHPMKRVMQIQDVEDGIDMTFTDMHLPRDVGNAVHSAYGGELDLHYDDAGYTRAGWRRNT